MNGHFTGGFGKHPPGVVKGIPGPNQLRLVYPLEATVKGSLGGPLVKEWAVVTDAEGHAVGLAYDGNDKYRLALAPAARAWGRGFLKQVGEWQSPGKLPCPRTC